MENDIEEFIKDCAKRFCPFCGVAITPNANGRPKKFCSDKCRWDFHKRKERHPFWEMEVTTGENGNIENDSGKRA